MIVKSSDQVWNILPNNNKSIYSEINWQLPTKTQYQFLTDTLPHYFYQVAMEMLFTGTPISSHDALLHGLVSKVVPEERLEEETLAIAQRVCQASRPVVALGKATFQR